jgi:hypothetical protein
MPFIGSIFGLLMPDAFCWLSNVLGMAVGLEMTFWCIYLLCLIDNWIDGDYYDEYVFFC